MFETETVGPCSPCSADYEFTLIDIGETGRQSDRDFLTVIWVTQ